MLGPVRSDTEGNPKVGIIPDPSVKSEDPEYFSKTSESPETSMSPPKKEKSKTVVRINPEPFVKQLGVVKGLIANLPQFHTICL